MRAALDALLGRAKTIRAAQDGFAEAVTLAKGYTGDRLVRFALLQLRERAGQQAGLANEWAALLATQADDVAVFRFYVRRLIKDQRSEEALALIDRRFPDAIDDAEASFARAEILSDVQAHEASDALFVRVIATHDQRNARISFAKRLRRRGLTGDAYAIILPIIPTFQPGSKAAELAAELGNEFAFFSRFEPEDALPGQNVKTVAMAHAVKHFTSRAIRPVFSGEPARIALLTGTLGAGGAERQLSRLASHLHRGEGGVAGSALESAPAHVEVIVKQHGRGGGAPEGSRKDFFLDLLLEIGVPVVEINDLPAISTARQGHSDPDLLRLLANLPPQVHYGVTRLYPYLRDRNFDVVSLWQDGTCLFGALAALLAGVPVIHLVFRGLPPNIREERYRPEYAVLYRALTKVPGVHFVSNSHAAALEYARWLDLPLDRFRVLYNGVPPIDPNGTDVDLAHWTDFATRTADATETIGGVFRMESDKRPLLWIKLAHRYLKRRPKARFVIVGDGRLRQNAHDLAQELGISDRILFVLHSWHIGFWYAKMDVKVLLSRFEGLPNVLIEAQLMGVRTVATPAGGAGECFIDGETGHLLASAEHPDLDEACDKIVQLAQSARTDGDMSQRSVERASTLFSVDAVIERFLAMCNTETLVCSA